MIKRCSCIIDSIKFMLDAFFRFHVLYPDLLFTNFLTPSVRYTACAENMIYVWYAVPTFRIVDEIWPFSWPFEWKLLKSTFNFNFIFLVFILALFTGDLAEITQYDTTLKRWTVWNIIRNENKQLPQMSVYWSQWPLAFKPRVTTMWLQTSKIRNMLLQGVLHFHHFSVNQLLDLSHISMLVTTKG